MSESVRDYVTTYSFNKLEETAKTFRRLGEVYENAAEFKTADPGISLSDGFSCLKSLPYP